MNGIGLLKAYHRAYRRALEIHHKWADGDIDTLLRKASDLSELIKPLADEAGPDWGRSKHLQRHLKCVVRFLKDNDKDSAHSDINDLIYADLPGLCDELLKIAEKSINFQLKI
ncbi:hypothetical protein [Pseudomonas asplenii]|uniref:hypothetical protein n=1 Tax=Pseudomonas asplenii TaxID=53407 RepID=UPI00128F7313|nr:hypothetical protein [Pseudomonas fuscovaginae]